MVSVLKETTCLRRQQDKKRLIQLRCSPEQYTFTKSVFAIIDQNVCKIFVVEIFE